MKNVYLLFGAKGEILHVFSSMKVALFSQRSYKDFEDTFIRKYAVYSLSDI